MIYISSDHRGVDLKSDICHHLAETGREFTDLGPFSDTSVDYPDKAHNLISQMNNDDIGILICHTANGMCITANRYPEIRAGIAWNPEVARLIRQHNNANLLGIPNGFVQDPIQVVSVFLSTQFEGGRHQCRIDKINL